MAEDSALDKYIKPRVSVSWYINIKRLFALLIILRITSNKFYNFNVINRQLFCQMIWIVIFTKLEGIVSFNLIE